MTKEDTRQISADNLRADILNATTNWQRWKVLNQALDWAVTASELTELRRTQPDTRSAYNAVKVGDRTLYVGAIATGDAEEDGWIVRAVYPDGRVSIAPLGEDWGLREQIVDAESLFT